MLHEGVEFTERSRVKFDRARRRHLCPGKLRSERTPDHSPPVNQTLPSFEETYAWGARTHPFRNGGFRVNRSPPFRLSRMSQGVRELGWLASPFDPALESRIHPAHL